MFMSNSSIEHHPDMGLCQTLQHENNSGISVNLSVAKLSQSALWFITNNNLHKDLNIASLSQLNKSHYVYFHSKLLHHNNPLIKRLSSFTIPDNPLRRLKRTWPRYLLIYFVGWHY